MSDNLNAFVSGANERLQENVDQAEPTIFASYGLIGAIVAFGGLGYLMDRWLATMPWLLLAGLGVGLCVGFSLLVQVARHR